MIRTQWRHGLADLVLVPCRPGILDLRAIGSTARIVKVAGTPPSWSSMPRHRMPLN
jgi:hypothetical protein